MGCSLDIFKVIVSGWLLACLGWRRLGITGGQYAFRIKNRHKETVEY